MKLIYLILIIFYYIYIYQCNNEYEFPTYNIIDDESLEILDNSHINKWMTNISCSEHYNENFINNCHVKDNNCARIIIDNFVTNEDINKLKDIAYKGFNIIDRIEKPIYGPTIMDINSGYVLSSNYFMNLYQPLKGQEEIWNKYPKIEFTIDEYSFYHDVIGKIKKRIEQEFGISTLYFTSPTFFTRINGHKDWVPNNIHDEYYHIHVDKENSNHYDISGLLYLSDYLDDFNGGLFHFFKQNENNSNNNKDIDIIKETTVMPKKGRLSIFNSGRENPHKLDKVLDGTRLVLSFWFTCNREREFFNYLDGKPHMKFSHSDEL